MTIIVSDTASKKVVMGWRRRAFSRVAAKPKAMAKTTTPRMASSAAARIGLDGARVCRKAVRPSPSTLRSTSSARPAVAPASAWPPAGSIGQTLSQPRPAAKA